MRFIYDKEVDALAIELDDTEIKETKNIAPGVEVDYDFDGRVVTIEILGAASQYDLSGLPLEAPSPYLSLAEAGELTGISPTTLRHQIARGVLKGVKSGRNWTVHHRDLFAYTTKRSRKARKSLAERMKNASVSVPSDRRAG